MTIENLRQINDRLTALLSDPHPGLFTWTSAVQSLLTQLAESSGATRRAYDDGYIAGQQAAVSSITGGRDRPFGY